MSEFECEMTDDGDVLVRHVRQGHEYFFRAEDGLEGLILNRAVRGQSALDDLDVHADTAMAFAGRQRAFSR